MSKRAEELEKFSDTLETYVDYSIDDMCNAFVKGYEQAEKDTIERVIEWVKRNGYLYVNRVKEGDEYVGEFMEEPFIESLRKAMEDKK